MTEFIASPQQGHIFSWVTNGQGSAIIEAVAGAGKTTTLVQALRLMLDGGKKVFLGAYNKDIAVEISEKCKAMFGENRNLTVSTMHSAGFRIWRKVAKRVQVNANKCRDIYRAGMQQLYIDAGNGYGASTAAAAKKLAMYEQMQQLEGQVLSLVSYAKQAAVGFTKKVNDDNVWFDLIDHFDIDCLEQDDVVVRLAKRLIEASFKRDMDVVDYDDMILAPLVHGARPDTYDWVLIDEAQDTNASRRALALFMLKRGGRLVAVGDPHQAIYGFTGADADALNLIAHATNATRLPLTVTYRCPKAVVAYAKQWVSHIESHETAPEGVVRNLDKKLSEDCKPGDVILCRMNAPLIQLVYEFIANGVPAKVLGRDIGSGLKALARRWKVKSFDAMQVNLENFVERETAKFRAKEEENKAVAIEDKVNCLLVIMERAKKNGSKKNPVDAVCDEIDSIFSKNDESDAKVVTLSSIHKAKGKEWDRVFWAETGVSKWAKQDWELEQEKNLCYVAATRAKKELVLFPAPTGKKEKEAA